VDHPQDFQGLLRVLDGQADEGRFHGPCWPLASFGEPFQVGRPPPGNWRSCRLDFTQWARAPRGAQYVPTPFNSPLGQVEGSHCSMLAVRMSPALMFATSSSYISSAFVQPAAFPNPGRAFRPSVE